MNKICCFCKSCVLGIPGQDDVLDTFNLNSSTEDLRAIDAKIYGHCHIKCFADSTWFDFWMSRRIKNFTTVRNFSCLLDDPPSLLFRDFRSGGNLISPSPGILLLVSDRDIASSLDVVDSSIGFRLNDQNWQLPPSQKGESLNSLFGDNNKIPLLRIAELFGVADRLLDVSRASKGIFSVDDKKTANYFKKGILTGTVSCSVSLPKNIIDCLVKL